MEGVVKKFMFVNRKAPYGTIYALESLEVVLISAAFDQDVSLAFLDDGVFQLRAAADADNFPIQPRGFAANRRPEFVGERAVNHAQYGDV